MAKKESQENQMSLNLDILDKFKNVVLEAHDDGGTLLNESKKDPEIGSYSHLTQPNDIVRKVLGEQQRQRMYDSSKQKLKITSKKDNFKPLLNKSPKLARFQSDEQSVDPIAPTQNLNILNSAGRTSTIDNQVSLDSVMPRAEKTASKIKNQSKNEQQNTNSFLNSYSTLNNANSGNTNSTIEGKTPFKKLVDDVADIRTDIKKISELIKHIKPMSEGSTGTGRKEDTGKDSLLGELSGLAALIAGLLVSKFGNVTGTITSGLTSGFEKIKQWLHPDSAPGGPKDSESKNPFKGVGDLIGSARQHISDFFNPNTPKKLNDKAVDAIDRASEPNATQADKNAAIMAARKARAAQMKAAKNASISQESSMESEGESLLDRFGNLSKKIAINPLRKLMSGAAGVAGKATKTVGRFVGGIIGAEAAYHGYEAYKDWQAGDKKDAWGEGYKALGTLMMGGHGSSLAKGLLRSPGSKAGVAGLSIGEGMFFGGDALYNQGDLIENSGKKDAGSILNAKKDSKLLKKDATYFAGMGIGGVAGAAIGGGIGALFGGVGAVPGAMTGAWIGSGIGGAGTYLNQNKSEISKDINDFGKMLQNIMHTIAPEKTKILNDRVTQNAPRIAAASGSLKPNITQHVTSNNTTNINIGKVDASSVDAAKKNLNEALRKKEQQDAINKKSQEMFSNNGLSGLFNSMGTAQANATNIMPAF